MPLECPLEEPSWTPEFREGIIKPIIPSRTVCSSLYPVQDLDLKSINGNSGSM
jgi:hypothetical protein